MSPPIITLTTDFGSTDSYVGVMKGVILSICPTAHIIDISHAIPPQQIAAGVRVLAQAVPYFPAHSVHVVVVDPGVGSARRPIALASSHGRFVGPDNGLFGAVWQQGQQAGMVRGVLLDNPAYWLPSVSATFHGRDLFAPVAAHLAAGVALERLGSPLAQPQMLALPEPQQLSATELRGEVVAIDHFGNCISNISRTALDALGSCATLSATFGAGSSTPPSLALRRTYADVPVGAPVALIGSSGYLELAVREGHASQHYGITTGAPVVVRAASPLAAALPE